VNFESLSIAIGCPLNDSSKIETISLIKIFPVLYGKARDYLAHLTYLDIRRIKIERRIASLIWISKHEKTKIFLLRKTHEKFSYRRAKQNASIDRWTRRDATNTRPSPIRARACAVK